MNRVRPRRSIVITAISLVVFLALMIGIDAFGLQYGPTAVAVPIDFAAAICIGLAFPLAVGAVSLIPIVTGIDRRLAHVTADFPGDLIRQVHIFYRFQIERPPISFSRVPSEAGPPDRADVTLVANRSGISFFLGAEKYRSAYFAPNDTIRAITQSRVKARAFTYNCIDVELVTPEGGTTLCLLLIRNGILIHRESMEFVAEETRQLRVALGLGS